jgi:hypothetical protein
MPKPSIKPIWLELQIDPNDPELLAILDRLVRSNILTHTQIRKIARECLSEDLPWKSARVDAPVIIESETSAAEIPAASVAKVRSIPVAPVPKVPSPIQTIWRTLKDELSVRWLLFLGVFLVVLSSGVLAATQWSRFPAWGQYGLLWLYSIGFWVVGGWARRQEGLGLTASTLQLVTILLIPVNFWAIDSFGLFRQPLELVTVVVAGVSLVGIAYLYWRGSVENQRLKPTRTNSRWLLGAYVVLSLLHLGWQMPYWSTIGIYIGAIGSVVVLQKVRRIEGGALVIYGLGILLVRGLFVAHLPIYTFGLAIGIVGWLFAQWSLQKDRQLARLNRKIERQLPLRVTRYRGTLTEVVRLYRGIGVSLLLLGWLLGLGDLVSAPKSSSWQAFGVSCLALVWIWQRLRKDWQNREVVVLFLIGLETYIVSSFLWAPLSTGAIFAKLSPFLLLVFGQNYLIAGSLLIFPYLLGWVWLTGWFHRQEKASAYQIGESLLLATGALLPIVNISNPLSLLIDLLVSTAILAYLTVRYPPIRSTYIYLTHICGLVTIFAAISYRAEWCRSIFSNFVSGDSVLDLTVLAIALSILTIGELWFSAQPVGRKSDPWRRSSWHVGWVLAALTYVCFATLATFPTARIISPLWWLLVPIAFTYIATRKPPIQPWQLQHQIPAAWFGIAGLGGGLLLTIDRPEWRSIVLIASVGIMFPLVKRLKQLAPALIQIGLGLGLGVNLLIGQIFPTYWLIIGAITCACLWFASPKLSPIYAEASDIWANGIAGLGIAIGTINYAQTDLNWFTNVVAIWLNLGDLNSLQTALEGGSTEWFHSINFTILLSTVILVGSIALRERWRNSSIFEWNWFFAWSWAIQIALAALIHLLGGDTLTLATANIILAFPLWLWMNSQTTVDVDSKILICVLTAWGLILRLPFFTAYTGLLTLAVGILAVSISRRCTDKSIGYGGILLLTLGCYELVAYLILQSPPGGNIADALTIYGLVTAVLALAYRLGVWWKSRREVDNLLGIPLPVFKNVAHIHWAVASTWKVAAATMPAVPMPKLTLLHLFISVLLGGYALIQARDKEHGDWWIYLGLAELLGVGVYARSIFQNLGVVDNGIILIACTIGLLLLLAPWRQWGWQDRPWRLVAFVLPLSRVVFEYADISLLNLAVLAVFYAGVARRQRQFIWNYLSLIFINWAAMRLLFQYQLTSPLWYATLIGLSILTVVQWDPYWQTSKQNRHYGRVLGSSTIAVTALVWHQPWLPIGIGLAIGIIGLALKVRAWFYIGTITFLLTNLYQLLILITEYPITKWAIGLFAGILIITLAANFERRKEQIEAAVKHWIDRLQEWQ